MNFFRQYKGDLYDMVDITQRPIKWARITHFSFELEWINIRDYSSWYELEE